MATATMIPVLLGAHLVVSILLPMVARSSVRAMWALAAAVPLATAAWAGWLIADDATTSAATDGPLTWSIGWVDALDLEFAFRIDATAAMMTLLVSGIGALVFVYASGYFSSTASGLARFVATLFAFSFSMLGLVWSDSVWSLFVFWEATSITSFLLVGHKYGDKAAAYAARRALVITAGGGLVLLGGLVAFVDGARTGRLTDLEPATGAAATAAGVLVIIAAATKSALVPFHVWLPGAMSAPTPVSAYLHSATMVKAGVLLILLVSPALGDTPAWTPLGVAFGGAALLWGAIGALRQVDAKLILAWGTVSQLGLIAILGSLGSGKATFAAVSMLFAHALFKAALFMVVGEVDVRAGTRNVTELTGLWRSMPVAFVVMIITGASMAGLPPILGFTTKEAAVEAVIGLEDDWKWVAAPLVIVGSVLTVAYTVRLLIGVFGPFGRAAADRRPPEIAPRRPAMAVPSIVLATLSVLGFVVLEVPQRIVLDAAVETNSKSAVYSLLRWPGLTAGLMWSIAIVAVGSVVGVVLARRIGLTDAPRAIGAQLVDRTVDGTVAVARRIAARVQHGSLPVYVVTAAFVASIVTVPFITHLVGGVSISELMDDVDDRRLVLADSPIQAVLVVAVVVASVAVARIRTRFGAALGLGAVGFAVAGLFLQQGAPDLALTQLLVETVVVVGFVVGLGRLDTSFPEVRFGWRTVRVAVGVLAGVGVALGLIAASSAPGRRAEIDAMAAEAVDEGGGNNIVNVILTDIRALDTFGEVVVLIVVAVGIMALASRSGSAADADGTGSGAPGDSDAADPGADGERADTTAGSTPETAPGIASATVEVTRA